MAIITTGNSFNATDAVTSTKLNNIANAATFVAGAVDGTSLELKSDGKLGVKDDGITLSKVNANAIGTSQLVDNAVTTGKILNNAVTTDKILNEAVTTAKIDDSAVTTAKIDDSAVTTAKLATSSSKSTGVTFAKMQHISTDKILGRTSSGDGDVQEINFLDEDNMSSNSNTSVATQQSIKAYVDSSGIIQTALGSTTTQVSTTLGIPHDDTTPLITEGISAGLSATMTPTSTSSTIRATLNAYFGNSNAGQYIIIATFEGNTCVGVSQIQQPSSGNTPLSATYYFNPASTSEQTYSVRFGKGASGNVRLDTTPTLGGLNKATLFLEEISG